MFIEILQFFAKKIEVLLYKHFTGDFSKKYDDDGYHLSILLGESNFMFRTQSFNNSVNMSFNLLSCIKCIPYSLVT